jgi:hypothetical protein
MKAGSSTKSFCGKCAMAARSTWTGNRSTFDLAVPMRRGLGRCSGPLSFSGCHSHLYLISPILTVDGTS